MHLFQLFRRCKALRRFVVDAGLDPQLATSKEAGDDWLAGVRCRCPPTAECGGLGGLLLQRHDFFALGAEVVLGLFQAGQRFIALGLDSS